MTLSNKIYMFEYTPHMSHNLDIFLARYYHCISNVNIKAIFFHLLLQFYIAAMHFSKRKFVFRPDKKTNGLFYNFFYVKKSKAIDFRQGPPPCYSFSPDCRALLLCGNIKQGKPISTIWKHYDGDGRWGTKRWLEMTKRYSFSNDFFPRSCDTAC